MQIKSNLLLALFVSLIALVRTTSVSPQPTIPQVVLDSGSYIEEFTSYTNKASVDNAVWDIWQGHVRLARRDSIVQYNPVVTRDGEGNIFLVWADSRNGNGNGGGSADIYAQKLDDKGNRMWASDVQVNGNSGTANHEDPVIAIDNEGNLLLVWVDYRNGDGDVYAQKLNTNGDRLWTNDIRVNSDSNNAPQKFPDIVSDSSGNLLLVWQDYRNGDADIYVQKLDGDGSQMWVNDVRVNSDVGTDNQTSPAITNDSNGNLLLVWQDHRNGDADVYAQKLSGDGDKLWSQDIRVNSDAGLDAQALPAIASDNDGNSLVVWQDSRNGDTDVYAQKVAGNGDVVWVNDIRVNSDAGTASQSSPVIASDSDGNLFVAWEDYRNSHADIYAQKLFSNGTKAWGNDFRINRDSGTTSQQAPDIVSDSNGNLVLVWRDYRNVDTDIYAQKLSGEGNHLWAKDVRVNHDSGVAGQWFPSIASDNEGNILLVWEDHRNGNTDIYAQKFDGDANKIWDDDVRVNSDSGIVSQIYPSIVSVNDGSMFLVWEDHRNGNADIYAQKLNANGNKLWVNDVRINSDVGGAWQTASRAAGDNEGNLLVVWADYRNGHWDVYVQKLDGNGDRLWMSDARANSDGGSANQTSPAIASDSSGNLLLMWRDDRNGKNDVYAQKLDVDGNHLWGDDVHVNSDSTTAWQPPPAIASDSDGNLLVTWSDDRNGNNDVFAQKLDTDGNHLWINDVRVNSDGGTSGQAFPAIASDSDGNSLLVWQDYRNGDANLYAQKLDGNGVKLWINDIRVNSDAGTAWQSTPAIASSSAAHSLFVWRDYRNGNTDIYAQKLDSNGNQLWMQDVQMVFPDLFYLSEGQVESETVDATTANIISARLEATVQLNGGEIQFFITNNGGQEWEAVNSGDIHVFTTMGSDLRWRATLTANEHDVRQGPIIENLNIIYGSILPPTNLTANVTSSSEIELNWLDNSDNEMGFKIERSPDDTSNWAQISLVGSNASSYQDVDLNCDTTYYYRVRAYNDGGDSAYSNIASATTMTCTDTGNWLFLVYMACDADAQLNIACQHAIDRLQQAAANPSLDIIALYDKPGPNNSVRYHIQADGSYVEGVNQWHLGEVNTADPQTLANFISWGLDGYQTEHIALFVLGHGLGHAALAWDFTTGDNVYMRPAQLREALGQGLGGRTLDLVYYDACLMGLLEHAYALDGVAQVMIASENPIWLPFPYHRLQMLVTPTTDAYTLSQGVVSAYATQYPHRPITISALDITQVGLVAQAVDNLAQTLRTYLQVYQTSINYSRLAAQKFLTNGYDKNTNDPTNAYLDLYDFARRLETFVNEPLVKAAAMTVMTSIGQPGQGGLVIAEAHRSGLYNQQYYWDLDNARGVAVYFPHASGGAGYDDYISHQFQFTRDFHWDDFLIEYYGILGFPPEPGGPPQPPPALVSDYMLFLPAIVK